MSFDSYTPIELITDGTPITYGVVQPGPEDADGVLFIRGGDISGGRINTSNLRTISSELSYQYKRTLLKGGELVISLVGNPGEVAVVPDALKGANIARQVGLVLKPINNGTFIILFHIHPLTRSWLCDRLNCTSLTRTVS